MFSWIRYWPLCRKIWPYQARSERQLSRWGILPSGFLTWNQGGAVTSKISYRARPRPPIAAATHSCCHPIPPYAFRTPLLTNDEKQLIRTEIAIQEVLEAIVDGCSERQPRTSESSQSPPLYIYLPTRRQVIHLVNLVGHSRLFHQVAA